MRGRIFLFIILLFSIVNAKGQSNIPTSVAAPPVANARPLSFTPAPAAQYFRILMPVMPISDTAKVRFAAPIDSIMISTQYVDGLGRPLETVVKQGSPLKNDNVSANTYDDFGRQSILYLPYVATSSNGLFNQNPFKGDSTFYKTNFPDEQINYSVDTYDGSPLNQVQKSTAAGNSWTGGGVGTSYSMRANTAADSVRLWTIGIVNEDDVPSTSSIYTAGSLIVQQSINERGIKSVIYKDELGRTILTKQQVSSSPSSGHYGWLCTYYVYDEMNQVRVVIPPKGVDALNTSTVNWNLVANPAIKSGLCFSYFYDTRGRAIMKYIPGKGKNYFAYDLLDRVVMTQDANLRQTNQWAFVLYDGQCRPWRSGVITNAVIKDTIIAQASRSSAYPSLSGTYTITSETYYDDYSWISGGAPNSSLVSTYINSTNFNTSYNTAPDYSQPIMVNNRIRGAVTGTKKIILNSATYLYTVNLYDDHGRVIQVKQSNYTNGTDILTNQYSFAGRTIRSHLYQQKSGTNAQTHMLLTKYNYDAAGRLKSLIKNIDGLGDKAISSNQYNELGQLQGKVLGSGIDSEAYAYNIRGWLTSINKDYVDNYNSTAHYFGEAVFYNFGFTANQLNGAIAGVKWKAAGDTIARAYGFAYDNANRLTGADFSQNVRNSSNWTNSTVDFSVSTLTYDGGGNILSMNQKGLTIGSSTTIDSLKYQYYTNSNQLQKVTDLAAYTSVGLGDFRDTALAADDYAYDVNGNITKDYNRKMHTPSNGNGAVYNLLDKPDSLVISGKATTYYYYDAGGSTIRKVIKDYTSGLTKTYLYLAGFVYLNDTLQYVNTEEGRIRKKGAAFVYDYYLRDHLNNVRTVLTEEKDTAFYPPASLETAQLNTERLLYSGVDNGRVNKNTVPGYPADNYTNPNDYIQQLSGSGYKTGTGIILKVMTGDKYNIRVSSWYKANGATPGTPVNPLPDLLAALASGISGTGATHGITGTQLQSSGVLTSGATNFLNSRSYTTTIPKAYLNWILFDDQFKMVTASSSAQQVGADNTFTTMVQNGLTAAKNGYLYVYVSNETPNINVYFDNLQVTHIKGPLLQEQSYYPFGLQMAGISDQAMGKLGSKNKFNGGVELEEDYGVNLYSTFYRKYDPQIGRFSGVDCQSEASIGMSVYQFGGNNPVSLNDPLGNRQTAGLYGGRNGYYNFPENHHHESADPLSSTFMDPGGDGGGGSGTGDYSAFWSNVLYQVNSGEDLTGADKGTSKFFYQYGNQSESGTFRTPNNDGVITYAAGEDYHLIGGVTETTYSFSSTSSYNFHSSNGEGDGWLESTIHLNDGTGGLGSGLDYSSGTFRITNGTYNGSEFSFKYYSSGWKGGSRAGISTYEVSGFGKGLAKGSLVVGVVLGGIGVYQGYQEDGGTYGTNAQLATGNAIGGLVGGWAGAETGATFGAGIGVWFGGAGAVPGAIIGGIIGGVVGGFAGSEAGEDGVRDIRN